MSSERNINELIARCTEENAEELEYVIAEGQQGCERYNILIRDMETYARFKEELGPFYRIIEFDASRIIFFKIISSQGGEFCKINHGPGTEYTVIRESELDSYCSIEEPVVFYYSGSFTSEINHSFRTMFEEENTLVVIKNIDKIEIPANRSVFLRFIWNDEHLPPVPVIVLLENVDNRVFSEIRADSKERYYLR